MQHTEKHIKYLFLTLLLVAALGGNVSAQRVTLDARITERGLPVWMVSVTCDGLDSTFAVMPDTATGHFRIEVPRGRCLLNSFGNEEILLDLQSDTTLDIQAKKQLYVYSPHIYRSRQQKDSLLRAQEAALKACLDGTDTNHWSRQPNYAILASLMNEDLFYVLPRWRTFSPDTVLFYMKYCYQKDPTTYDYLYYPICQLEHRLGLKHDRRVRKPKAPDGRFYVPMPVVKEDWLTDTVTDYGGLFERARDNSEYIRMQFATQGEPSLVYPQRKKPAVRMLFYAGYGNSTAFRVEDGRFYYCTADVPWNLEYSRHNERWPVKLTRAELDTLALCLDTLLMAGDEHVLDVCNAIDALQGRIEYTDTDGYRKYRCDRPWKNPFTAPLYKFLENLRLRNTHRFSVPVIDAANGKSVRAHITLKGCNYNRIGYFDFSGVATLRLPQGKYTLLVEGPGYESYEQKLNIQGDHALDTIFLQHKRISFRTCLYADNGIHFTDTVALYVDGVDTAILAPIDWVDQTVEYHDVPAASRFYFVEIRERNGGWYHSEVYSMRDSMDYDSIPMHLDRSRPPFHSCAEKDSILKADVFHWGIGGPYPFTELGILYYYDALLKRMPTWQTFPDADSLAYDALCRAYHYDSLQYGYLYYPISHLAELNWHLKKDTSIRKPILNDTCYVPMPEKLWKENHYERYDLLSPFLKAKEENDHFRKRLASMQEPGLLVPSRQGPVVRWHFVDHHGITLYSMRIEGDTLYDKELFNTYGLIDPLDTTIDQDPEHYPDTLIVRKRPLTVAERDTLRSLLKAIDHEGYNGMLGKMLGISPTVYHYEYILDGHYHHFSALHNLDDSPSEPSPPVNALLEWVSKLLE